jgi:CubicO group peptidase (beta-lactamase class C family)
MLLRLVTALSLLVPASVLCLDFTPAREVLSSFIGVAYPGAVAAVIDETGFLFLEGVGNFTYGAPAPLGPNRPMLPTTRFDMASLTKVTATTTLVMIMYQNGDIGLDEPVMSYLPLFGANGKAAVTITNLLVHNSGFPPDPSPGYFEEAFGCPATMVRPSPPQVFTCLDRVYRSVMAQRLVNPIGEKYVYSDLSFITLMYVVGVVAREKQYVSVDEVNPACLAAAEEETAQAVCWYEAAVRVHLVRALALNHTGFGPLMRSERPLVPPTWNSTYLHEVMQGVVSDGNAYALGGISGHAGFFSSVQEIGMFVKALLFGSPLPRWVLSPQTIGLFTKVYNITQSSRALGWDTEAPNGLGLCDGMSDATFTHTGYTGTMICADPVNAYAVILFTNRCYPDDSRMKEIMQARPAFTRAVAKIMAQK